MGEVSLRLHPRALRFGALSLGDVARHAEEQRAPAVGIGEGSGVHLQPAVRSLETDRLELEDPLLTTNDSAMQVRECGVILRDQIVDKLLLLHLGERVRFQHREAGRIHLLHLPRRRHDLDAFRLGVDDRAQPRLALAQCLLHAVPLRHVAEHEHDAHDRPVRRADGGGAVGDL
jgi:hypothetical protein